MCQPTWLIWISIFLLAEKIVKYLCTAQKNLKIFSVLTSPSYKKVKFRLSTTCATFVTLGKCTQFYSLFRPKMCEQKNNLVHIITNNITNSKSKKKKKIIIILCILNYNAKQNLHNWYTNSSKNIFKYKKYKHTL